MTPEVLFLGTTYAGWKTRFLNVKAHTQHDPRMRGTYRAISGWKAGGAIERMPLLPRSARGRLRGLVEASAFASFPRADVIWLGGVANLITPYLWAQLGQLRRPIVNEIDWTLEQQEAFAPAYFGRPARTGPRLAFARLLERLVWQNTTLFTPMSSWAADSLARQGVARERIHVIHPGVDLDDWPRLRRRQEQDGDAKLRLLFVGGDFERKGGPLLVDVVRTHFADRCELDLVTPAAVEPRPGIRVHRAEPNSRLLRDLYAQADLFVLPTQADCYGHVLVEALASGVPVIATKVGGISDIVDENQTGWLIEPTGQSLVAALQRALSERERLPELGVRGRAVVEQRFDGCRNDERLASLLIDQVGQNGLRRLHRGADTRLSTT